jgi:hypothetical protein
MTVAALTVVNSHILIIVAVLSGLFAASPVFGQTLQEPDWDKARITERQLELNDEAVSSMVRGKPERSVALLTEALTYGEANILYLNLGRAYQKTGNCVEARKALRSVASAPKVDDPPPTIIDEKAQAFLEELEAECTVGGRPSEGSSNMLSDQRRNPWPIVTLGAGGALLAGGTVMLVAADAQATPIENASSSNRVIDYSDQEAARREQRASTFGTIGVGALAAGAVLSGIGSYLLLRSSDQAETRSQIGVSITRNATSAFIRWEL